MTILLVLATLGDATQIGFVFCRPRWPNTSMGGLIEAQKDVFTKKTFAAADTLFQEWCKKKMLKLFLFISYFSLFCEMLISSDKNILIK